MKQQNYSFIGPDIIAKSEANRDNPHRAFDWDKAAEIIKERFAVHPDLVAEAGLQGDWDYTGGEIFRDGKPTNDDYTYLSSHWATPTLILSWDDEEQEEVPCWVPQTHSRFTSKTKWDEQSLAILGIQLQEQES